MTCRLLSSFVITAGVNDILKITQDPGGSPSTQDLTFDPGTYFLSDDGASDDFIADVVQQLNDVTSETWTVDIQGIGASEASTAEGRVKITYVGGADDWDIEWDHAGTTVDPRILGFLTTSADSSFLAAGGSVVSPHVHRYGYYPQLAANDDTVFTRQRGATQYGSQGKPAHRTWGAEYEWMRLVVSAVARPFVHVFGAEDSATATAHDLTQNDLNAAYERFGLDVGADDTAEVRYYADLTDTATFKGPYKFSESSPKQWQDPLVLSRRDTRSAGELWSVISEWETSQ